MVGGRRVAVVVVEMQDAFGPDAQIGQIGQMPPAGFESAAATQQAAVGPPEGFRTEQRQGQSLGNPGGSANAGSVFLLLGQAGLEAFTEGADRDCVDLARIEKGNAQHRFDGACGETGVPLEAAQALLGNGSEHPPVSDQAGRAGMTEIDS